SKGDTRHDVAIGEMDETGVFTGALDQQVLDGEIDAAIHSLKDCPTDQHPELEVAAIPARATPLDMLVGLSTPRLSELEPGTTIGTSSRRRRANVLYENDRLHLKKCRGNVPTRLDKLNDDQYDGIIIAAAGLERVGKDLEQRPSIQRLIRTGEMLPAPGQGALAVVCRSEDKETLETLREIDHTPSHQICGAERSLLATLEGGCQIPIGALGSIRNDQLLLKASVTSPDGSTRITGELKGPPEEYDSIGKQLAEDLIDRGARELLSESAWLAERTKAV
ncbi:MAG: hydroxymethylbilane synthase, partial [bacterium]